MGGVALGGGAGGERGSVTAAEDEGQGPCGPCGWGDEYGGDSHGVTAGEGAGGLLTAEGGGTGLLEWRAEEQGATCGGVGIRSMARGGRWGERVVAMVAMVAMVGMVAMVAMVGGGAACFLTPH
ncbi:hypothetical protein CLOM_g22651 [Closterium sp. NIES-68]|nr:hypothetical protein CLOM_g22651 [Closterium sp. NIES-68]